jgi:uncharacterized protein YndB with AHSA1/START domain
MIKKIALVIVVLIAGILLYATTRPDSFQVQRSAAIKAPPEKVFPLINDFKRWDTWSPWEKKDPAMKRTFSASTSGKGATYAWEGNREVGKGRMEITESVPSSAVGLKLEFQEPFESQSAVRFTLEPRGDITQITWTMNGPMPYISKVITIFCDMDAMIGKDFETGLGSMKAAAEK